MDSGAVVTPPYVAGPLRLAPFHAVMLAASRIGDPAAARAFGRPYRSVAARLLDWQARGQMTRDEHPALYLHEYTSGGLTVRGLVGALDITQRATRPQDRAILPHEGIHPLQADELADRMAEMQLNPAPILLVHRAPAALRELVRSVAAGPPQHQFTDRNRQRHRIWAVRDPALLETIPVQLAPGRALIADGHHRYAAYLRLQRRFPGGPADRGLAMLVDQDDTPLFLGAIHRVLGGVSLADLQVAAESVGIAYSSVPAHEGLSALGPKTLVATRGDAWAALELRVDPDRPAVEVLHEDLVPALPRGPSELAFHHSVEDTLLHARRRRATAVLLPAPDVDQVLRVVAADHLLPEKATSFQPKPSVGVLIRSLRDG